jgi:hypothetical protein
MEGSTSRAIDFFYKPKKQIESSIRTRLTGTGEGVEPVGKPTEASQPTEPKQ